MARKMFVLAIFLMAASIGVLGFQAVFYLMEGFWPAVPVALIWVTLFGDMPDTRWMSLGRIWAWLGAVPVTIAGITLAYAALLISDSLRRR